MQDNEYCSLIWLHTEPLGRAKCRFMCDFWEIYTLKRHFWISYGFVGLFSPVGITVCNCTQEED